MRTKSETVTIGLGKFALPLTVILIVLKISGVLNISWWLVFLPMYLGLACVCLFFGLIFGFLAIVGLVIAILSIAIFLIELIKR